MIRFAMNDMIESKNSRRRSAGRIIKAKVVLLSVLLISIVLQAWAVLPPDEHQKLQEDFAKQADTRMHVTYSAINENLSCGFKSLLGGGCGCTAIYQIERVTQKPEDLEILAGDRLFLNYPCRKRRYDWLGSTVNWGTIGLDRAIEVFVPSTYLKHKGQHRWNLDNKQKIFSPLIPA